MSVWYRMMHLLNQFQLAQSWYDHAAQTQHYS